MKKTRSMSLLDEALQAWADTREGVIAEVKNLPEPALDFKPTDASRTARALVQHILESGLMMAGELTRAEGDFQRQSYPEFLAEYARDVTRHRTKTALVKEQKTVTRQDVLTLPTAQAGGFAVHVHLPVGPSPAPSPRP